MSKNIELKEGDKIEVKRDGKLVLEVEICCYEPDCIYFVDGESVTGVLEAHLESK